MKRLSFLVKMTLVSLFVCLAFVQQKGMAQTLSAVKVYSFPEKKSNGKAWDARESNALKKFPELIVKVKKGDKVLGKTQKITNARNKAGGYYLPMNANLKDRNSSFILKVVDDDAGVANENDLMVKFNFTVPSSGNTRIYRNGPWHLELIFQ